MRLDDDLCYRALRTHDTRFDGRFFVGVRTTGIYCRPVCAGRPPRRDNCRFFPSAAAAEADGFRPCLRCRPELAPGNAAVDATDRLAQQGAALIEEGLARGQRLEEVAARLGVTDRHLRRVFRQSFGVSPVEFAQTQRLLLAKRLLTDTVLPVTDVAMASGFGSVRRFNALFRSRYRLTPSGVRQDKVPTHAADRFSFALAYRPPLDWEALCGFFAARSIGGVDAVEGNVYRRTLRVDASGGPCSGWLLVTRDARRHCLHVTVSASLARALPAVLARVKRAFDLGCDPCEVAAGLGPLAHGRPGLRLPGAFDAFEVAVRAVLGQQVTVRAARTLATRFARAFGDPLETPFAGLDRLFPAPAAVASRSVDEVAALGIVGTRARTIVALARAVVSEELTLAPAGCLERTLERLRALPGIGEWTAQYIAMRALAWPDAFPHTDAGVRRALGERNPRRVLAIAEAWRPWRAYAVMHLWRSLEAPAS